MRKPQRVPPEVVESFCFEVPGRGEQLNWNRLFGNEQPVELEIGCGKGAFLVHAASFRPQTNFAGIEVVRKYQFYTADRLARRHLTNAKIACTDARFALSWAIPIGSLDAVHLYFPDPWWKSRHQKRRIVTPEFLVWVIRALKPEGHFHLASDVPEYFAISEELLAAQPLLQKRIDLGDERGVVTNFERKALVKGGAIHHGIWRRLGSQLPPEPPEPQRLFPVPVPGTIQT